MARRYLVVSGDSHAGPSLEHHLRPYCEKKYLEQFDEFAKAVRELQLAEFKLAVDAQSDPTRTQLGLEALARTKSCAGQQDPDARLRDMDADGIAAEVIFAGGMNDEVLPFVGFGTGVGPADIAPELRAEGCRIWNRWLADFVSVAPERLIGVMQIPIWDLDAAIEELEWGRQAGLRVANHPAPRPDFPAYNEDGYERYWAACEVLETPLACHSGGGEQPLGMKGRAAYSVFLAEVHWMSRRALWQMIFGGVFDRHPGLKLVFTEQRVAWASETLRDLDSIYLSTNRRDPERPERRPSEYWTSNCAICASFLAPFEAAMRHEIGLENLHWGSDYPHVEGTWPRTRLALRNGFAGIPEKDARVILEENPLRLYGLDVNALRPVADRIGPTPEELSIGLEPDEIPDFRSYAFREIGDYA
jgi:predicted TIM-barrel fold metal-dependent hydrolase